MKYLGLPGMFAPTDQESRCPMSRWWFLSLWTLSSLPSLRASRVGRPRKSSMT